jgi:hypothetical protein
VSLRLAQSEISRDSLAERSKAPDSSSGGAIRVGSNPTAVILCRFYCSARNWGAFGNHLIARGYGATVARLTPDQTVGRSNRSGLNYCWFS